jgi:hypothetical protein
MRPAGVPALAEATAMIAAYLTAARAPISMHPSPVNQLLIRK